MTEFDLLCLICGGASALYCMSETASDGARAIAMIVAMGFASLWLCGDPNLRTYTCDDSPTVVRIEEHTHWTLKMTDGKEISRGDFYKRCEPAPDLQ